MVTAVSSDVVTRRTVFFLPGFDPAPPRALRERYRREAALQSALSGHEIGLTMGQGAPFHFDIDAVIEGARVKTRYTVLVWSDLARGAMAGPFWASYRALFVVFWTYLRAGAFGPLARLRKGPLLAITYPVAVMVGQVAFALALMVLGGYFGGVIGAALGAVLAWFGLRYAFARDPFLAHYLMADYAFAAQDNGAWPETLAARMGQFAKDISAAAGGPSDEILLIGHSSGAPIAISLLADLIGNHGVAPARVSLLTLGHVVPMISFLPKADQLRADLAFLSTCEGLFWLDISAPADGCCFALCDPVAVSGLPHTGRPLILSAAFAQNLLPQTWARLRFRFFETHFQYLNAFDGGGEYDYFALTAGPKTLRARFGHRAPSPQKITRAVYRPKGAA